MSYGITPAGFVKKPYSVILAEIETSLRQPTSFGADVDLSINSPIGILAQLMANRASIQWEKLEEVYYSAFINTAIGSNLDRVVTLGGISRRPATKALVTLTISGTNGTAVGVGFKAQTPQGVEFQTIESGTIAAGTVDLQARAILAGTAGNAPAGTITEINTSLSGVSSVTNAADATGGAEVETDPELRARYKIRGSAGGATAVAIQAALNELEDVVTAVCYENNTNGSVDGMPPHSIEAVVDGGTDDDIMGVLLNFKPAGIEPTGTESGSIVDNAGVTRDFQWSRPTTEDVFVDVTITPGSEWVAGFVDQVKQKVIEEVGGTDADAVVWPGQGIGITVFAWRIIAALEPLVGIDNVTVLVGETASPTQSEVNMDRAERGITDLGDITVNVL